MGLDMYLYKEIFVGAEYHDRKISGKIEIYENGNLLKIDLSKISVIRERVMYWRKANAIHGWFVKNIQNNQDDCKDYYVSREELEELIKTCKEVINNKESAEILLPPVEGFLFGSNIIDEYYIEALENTVSELEKVLTESSKNVTFVYTSSW